MYIGGLVEQLSWDAVVPIWRFETRGVRTLQHLGMKSRFLFDPVLSLSLSKINSLWWFTMISMIYHLDQCWDDEMSILNLTKKHILGTCSGACNLELTLPRRTRSLWSLQLGDYKCPGRWTFATCWHATPNTRLDLRCAGSKNGALNIKKTVPLTRINIKNACLATHVNYEKNTLYKENIFEDNTGSRKDSSITHKKY